jgi:uncharacterized protein YjbJ (UPF0337 family)
MSDKQTPEGQQAEGTWDDIKGRAKEAGGAITGDGEAKREGKLDQAKGSVKKKVGEVREKIRDNI